MRFNKKKWTKKHKIWGSASKRQNSPNLIVLCLHCSLCLHGYFFIFFFIIFHLFIIMFISVFRFSVLTIIIASTLVGPRVVGIMQTFVHKFLFLSSSQRFAILYLHYIIHNRTWDLNVLYHLFFFFATLLYNFFFLTIFHINYNLND